MKTRTILFTISGQAKNVVAVCGRHTSDVETKQIATYSIENGVATITALTPAIATHLSISLPLVVPVNDLGSGLINEIEFDADTLTARKVTCPTMKWATGRADATRLEASLSLYPTIL
ncbi:hypothetical protein [Spirosoma aerophilum]